MKKIITMCLILLLILGGSTIYATTIDETKALITEWTLDSGDTITLPLSGTNMEFLVDWGDGSADTVTESYFEHTYTNDAKQTYEIKVQYIAGTNIDWGYQMTTEVTTDSLFYTYTQYLTKLTNWGEIEATEYGFARCTNLTEISGDATANTFKNVNDMAWMFFECTSLETINLSNWDTSNVLTMVGMFDGCKKVKRLDLCSFNTEKVRHMGYMFCQCNALESLNVSSFDTSNTMDMNYMFGNLHKLTSLNISNFNTSNVADMSYMFTQCSSLNTIILGENFNTDKVTIMEGMFYACTALETVDVSNFDTSNVTEMSWMFYNCKGLKSIDISKFDTSKTVTMEYMFANCNQITVLDVSGFDTQNVTNMQGTFWNVNVSVLDVSGFNTSKVTTMQGMFGYCGSVEFLDVSKFDTSNVTNMKEMFRNNKKIESLDLSNFDTSKVTNMESMFYYNDLLKSVLISNKFVIKGTTTNMFSGANSAIRFITVSNAPVANQFKGIITGDMKLYVPNGSLENYRTTLSGDTDSANIRPILESTDGYNPMIIKGELYEVDNVTVAGFAGVDEADYYEPYGYKLQISGDVDTTKAGKYKLQYILKRIK